MNFNITGTFEGEIPNLNERELKFVTSIENDENKIEANVKCSVIEIKGNNYTLACEPEEELEYDLQGAISINERDMFILVFDEETNSKITVFPSESYNKAYKNRGKKEVTGAIKGIIIVAIIVPLALISLITAIILLRKKFLKEKYEKNKNEYSTIVDFKRKIK